MRKENHDNRRKEEEGKKQRPMHETAGNADTGTVKTKGKKENRQW